jgi:hypothetical protein
MFTPSEKLPDGIRIQHFLQWLKNAIALAGVPYEIKYRPGRVHQNADCLSPLKISNINCIEKLEMPKKIKFISTPRAYGSYWIKRITRSQGRPWFKRGTWCSRIKRRTWT